MLQRQRTVALSRAANVRTNLSNGVAQADGQHGLARILKNVHDLSGRSLQVDGLSVGEQMVFRASAHGFGQTLSEFLLQKSNYLADTLERKPAASQFADHSNFTQLLHGVHAPVPFPGRNHDAALVPPLQLTSGDSGKGHHVTRSKPSLQYVLQTKTKKNVSNILGPNCSLSRKDSRFNGLTTGIHQRGEE